MMNGLITCISESTINPINGLGKINDKPIVDLFESTIVLII